MTDEEIINLAYHCGIIPVSVHRVDMKTKTLTVVDEGLDGDAACLVQFAHVIEARTLKLESLKKQH
jgi:hypothetical protein